MSEQLKPCPFCGGKAVKCDYQHENGGDYYFIKCDECESRSDEWGSITQAIQNWNTRLIEDTLRAEIAKLKEYHKGAIHSLNNRGEEHVGTLQAENEKLKAKVAEMEDENLEHLQAYFYDEDERNLCRFNPKKATTKEELMQLLFLYISEMEVENQRMREAIDDVLLGFPYLNVDTFLTINRQMEQRLRKALQGGE